jgi:hypothetical protein
MEIDHTSRNNTFNDVEDHTGSENQDKTEISETKSINNFNKNRLKSDKQTLISNFGDAVSSKPRKSLEIRDYISDIKEGIIGTNLEHPIDQIYDNIFNISVDEKINPAYQYTLEYDLYGVSSYKEVSKVINDDLAIGGKNVQKNATWIHQSKVN